MPRAGAGPGRPRRRQSRQGGSAGRREALAACPEPGLLGSCRNRVEREEAGELVSSRPQWGGAFPFPGGLAGGCAQTTGYRAAPRLPLCLSFPRWGIACRASQCWQHGQAPRQGAEPCVPLRTLCRGGGGRGPSCSPPAGFFSLSPFPSGAFFHSPGVSVAAPVHTPVRGERKRHRCRGRAGVRRTGLPAVVASARLNRATSCAWSRAGARPGARMLPSTSPCPLPARCSARAPPGPSGAGRSARRAW